MNWKKLRKINAYTHTTPSNTENNYKSTAFAVLLFLCGKHRPGSINAIYLGKTKKKKIRKHAGSVCTQIKYMRGGKLCLPNDDHLLDGGFVLHKTMRLKILLKRWSVCSIDEEMLSRYNDSKRKSLTGGAT